MTNPNGDTMMEIETFLTHENDDGADTVEDGDTSADSDESNMPIENLSLSMKLLFAVIGATLALPSTAIMYILNTRVEMSLTMIPTYGALVFLPFSLKPLYAYLSSKAHRYHHNTLLAGLFLGAALSTALSAAIPAHQKGVLPCIVLGFGRSLFTAWPDFLLSTRLVHMATVQSTIPLHYETVASQLQSQAATSRNLGSLVSQSSAWIFFLLGNYWRPGAHVFALNDVTVSLLFFATAVIYLMGAWIAIYEQSYSSSEPMYDHIEGYDNPETLNVETVTIDSPDIASFETFDMRVFVMFQLSIVIMALMEPITSLLLPVPLEHHTVTGIIMTWLILGGLYALCTLPWKKLYRVSLFLILKNAVPSAGFIMESFVYSIFASNPAALQFFSVFDMAMLTAGSWSYGNVLQAWTSRWDLRWVIAFTTVIASVGSLSDVVLVWMLPHSSLFIKIGLVLAIKLVMSIISEWKFLPNVILATVTSAAAIQSLPTSSTGTTTLDEPAHRNLRYGTLLSCIDLGDQVGALLTASVVALMGVERDWEGLDRLIVLCSLLGVLSAGLVGML
jgi:hypothetical protein